jgi:hypothetical protein
MMQTSLPACVIIGSKLTFSALLAEKELSNLFQHVYARMRSRMRQKGDHDGERLHALQCVRWVQITWQGYLD